MNLILKVDRGTCVELPQSPTTITYRVLEAADPFMEYVNWATTLSSLKRDDQFDLCPFDQDEPEPIDLHDPLVHHLRYIELEMAFNNAKFEIV